MTAGEPRLETDGSVLARDARLARRFVTLADTLVDDYDVLDLLDLLVTSCVDFLDVTAAGLLLKDSRGSVQLVASTSDATRIVELYQVETGAGPCVEAVRSGRPVAAHGLEVLRARWPSFAASAEANGFSSVFACPMRLREETIGALNVFGAHHSSLAEDDLRIAQALADVATIGILQQRSLLRASLVAEQLQTALNSRIVIEQAKGVLAEYARTDMDAAFQALRSHARSTNAKLSVVAERVVRRDLDPARIVGDGPHLA
jgi:transcriptional regulator with GAF, ATPase, and Fis domain